MVNSGCMSNAQGEKTESICLVYFRIGGSQVNNKAKTLLKAPAAQWGYVSVLINVHMKLRPLKQCKGSGRQSRVSGMKGLIHSASHYARSLSAHTFSGKQLDIA